MNTLEEFAEKWRDTVESHKAINELFAAKVNADLFLKTHRDFIETGHGLPLPNGKTSHGAPWGMGERSFHWLYKLVVDKMPASYRFLEIGVHRGQVVSLIGMLNNLTNRRCDIVAVSPFNGSEVAEEDESRNYRDEVLALFDHFGGRGLLGFVYGYSQDPRVVSEVQKLGDGQFDIVLIDGAHGYEDVAEDLKNYMPLVKFGGYLLTDDSACMFNQPFGYFCGIGSVSMAVDEVLPPGADNPHWKHLGNVVHLRVFQRVS